MPFGRKSPLEALALPGVMLAYKYSQFRQRRREAASRRVTERELSALHHKIDKLLSKLEESEPDPPTSQEDECVICINARATMQTSPCGHRVVCRRCFVKTIQSAVAQRLLPLRCVICRARVNRLTSSSGTWRIQESASSYSMGSKSWASANLVPAHLRNGVPASASSYSMSDAHSGLIANERRTFHGGGGGGVGILNTRYPRSPNGRVAQSASLYSMSSGSSTLSSVSNATNYSKTSSISSGLYTPSPSSPISPGSATSTSSCSVLGNHLAPPLSSSSTSPGSGGSLSPRDLTRHHHQQHSHHAGCPSGCSGAIPRKPLQSLSGGSTSSNASCSSTGSAGSGGYSSIAVFTPSTNTYPGRRHTKGRLMDLQNRLPPIKEFRSPAKVPHPSPVHINNPRFRYSSYTKSATKSHEMVPLLREPSSPPKRPMNIHMTSSLTTLGPPPLKAGGVVGGSAKISPLTTKHTLPKNAYIVPNEKKKCSSSNNNSNNNKCSNNKNISNNLSNNNNNNNNNSNINNKKLLQDFNSNTKSHATIMGTCNGGVGNAALSNSKMHHHRTTMTTSSSTRSFPLFSSSSSSNNHKEKADNKKNESMERKKKDEKLKQKAEKEARKEEKRLAKEEDRLAKLLAKEEKKKGKKEAKELLLANDGNNKK